MRQVIATDPRLEVIGEAADGAAALALLTAHQPDVAVLDIEMPELTGFALLRELRARRISTAVVFLTMYRDEEIFNEALDLGALGYVLKDSATTDIIGAIRAAAAGQPYISPAISAYLLNRARRTTTLVQQQPGLADLTPAERRVLKTDRRGQDQQRDRCRALHQLPHRRESPRQHLPEAQSQRQPFAAEIRLPPQVGPVSLARRQQA